GIPRGYHPIKTSSRKRGYGSRGAGGSRRAGRARGYRGCYREIRGGRSNNWGVGGLVKSAKFFACARGWRSLPKLSTPSLQATKAAKATKKGKCEFLLGVRQISRVRARPWHTPLSRGCALVL